MSASPISVQPNSESNRPGRIDLVINQNNAEIEILDRQTGKILSSFGRAGHFPGQFDQAHGIAVDSKGNVYIAENRGKRIQKFKIVSP